MASVSWTQIAILVGTLGVIALFLFLLRRAAYKNRDERHDPYELKQSTTEPHRAPKPESTAEPTRERKSKKKGRRR